MSIVEDIKSRYRRSRELSKLAERVYKHQNPGSRSNSPENQAVRDDIRKRLRKGTFDPQSIRKTKKTSKSSGTNRLTGYPANRRRTS